MFGSVKLYNKNLNFNQIVLLFTCFNLVSEITCCYQEVEILFRFFRERALVAVDLNWILEKNLD
jgi:hypothetical protein